jgi:hypothetical protein
MTSGDAYALNCFLYRYLLVEFSDARPISDMSRVPLTRLDTQVVRINADLLHFHSTPSASESSIGGVDLIGSNAAAPANATNAIMSKGRIIFVVYPYFPRLHGWEVPNENGRAPTSATPVIGRSPR